MYSSCGSNIGNRRMMMGGDASLNVSFNEDGEGQWQRSEEHTSELQSL